MKHLGIIILAAGSSSRMGRPKQLLPLHQSTLLGTVLSNAQNVEVASIYCVVGSNSLEIKNKHQQIGVQFIENPAFKNGLSTSITKAVQYITKEQKEITALLILLGDQPFLKSAFINKYLFLHKEFPEHIIATSYQNGVGVPALFPLATFDSLKTLKGDQGAKGIIHSYKKIKKITLPKEALIDIDTQEDYEFLLST